MIWLWLFILASGIVARPYLLELRRLPVAKIRHNAPGQFAKLSRGDTHYLWSRPEDGDVVVLVHGLTTPSFVWQSLTPVLTARGCRVLAYDHYGRGYSDRPLGAQDAAFFVSHLNELLADQGVTEPVTIVGYSMGGAIAAAYTAAHPDKVKQAILIAPAGMGHDLGFTAKLTQSLPVIGDWLFLAFYPKAHRKGCEEERAGEASTVENIFDLQLAEQNSRGFFRSVLSSLRGILSLVLEPQHRKIAKAGVPILAIWGSKDTIIPISCKNVLAGWNPDAKQVVIDGAGHGVTYTHTDQVAQAILDRL
jgi:pimeloyl-ACP methyl ester carboxylesterase